MAIIVCVLSPGADKNGPANREPSQKMMLVNADLLLLIEKPR